MLSTLHELGLFSLCVRQDARQLSVIITSMPESRGGYPICTWVPTALCVDPRAVTDVAMDFLEQGGRRVRTRKTRHTTLAIPSMFTEISFIFAPSYSARTTRSENASGGFSGAVVLGRRLCEESGLYQSKTTTVRQRSSNRNIKYAPLLPVHISTGMTMLDLCGSRHRCPEERNEAWRLFRPAKL